MKKKGHKPFFCGGSEALDPQPTQADIGAALGDQVGHGAGGWALASGSARAVADLIAQRSPDVSLDGLGIQRF